VIAYWDASALVLLYVDLPGRAAAQSRLDEAEVNLFSKLTIFETYRAIASLAARGILSKADGRRALGRLREDQPRMSARSVDGILQGSLLEKYLALLERHWTLGTNDVLHLTTAVAWKTELKRKITMATRDLGLAAAAKRERLEAFVPS
jgi:predicted nucleic acid-binding protein